MLQQNESTLILGLGGCGSRLAAALQGMMGCHCVGVSADSMDHIPGHDMIHVSCGVLVPTVGDIRAATPVEKISSVVSGFGRIIVVANLAGRSGMALAPVILRLCHAMKKQTATFCIMPFRYEADRIFPAGLAFKRVREYSDYTTVLDNDSLMECNPDMSVQDCYVAGNGALLYVAAHMEGGVTAGENVISAGRFKENITDSVMDAIKMLYETAPPYTLKKSIIHVTGNVSAGTVESVSQLVRDITKTPTSVMVDGSGESGTILVSSAQSIPKFDAYDPLGVIPDDKILDWEDPECNANLGRHTCIDDMEFG